MIYLNNYKLFLDKRISKKGNEYTALFMEIDEKEFLICYVNSTLYDYINNLSK